MTVGLDCDYGFTVLRSCYDDISSVDLCKVTTLGNQNETAMCKVSTILLASHLPLISPKNKIDWYVLLWRSYFGKVKKCFSR